MSSSPSAGALLGFCARALQGEEQGLSWHVPVVGEYEFRLLLLAFRGVASGALSFLTVSKFNALLTDIPEPFPPPPLHSSRRVPAKRRRLETAPRAGRAGAGPRSPAGLRGRDREQCPCGLVGSHCARMASPPGNQKATHSENSQGKKSQIGRAHV